MPDLVIGVSLTMVQMTVWLDGPVGPMGEDHPSTPTQALSGAVAGGKAPTSL
jgi:hypothetical protein